MHCLFGANKIIFFIFIFYVLTGLLLLGPENFALFFCLWDLKLTKFVDSQTRWHSGASPGFTNPGSTYVRNPASIKGASCAFYMDDVVLSA